MRYTLQTPRLVEDKQTNQMKRDGSMTITAGNNLENTEKFTVNVRYCTFRDAHILESLDNEVLIIWNQ